MAGLPPHDRACVFQSLSSVVHPDCDAVACAVFETKLRFFF